MLVLKKTALLGSLITSWRKLFRFQVLIPFFIFLGVGLIAEVIKSYVGVLQYNEEAKDLNRELQNASRILEQDLSETLYFSEGLQSYIESQSGQLVEEDILPWIANLQERARFIRNIGFAPGNRISLIYPLAGNEAALGLYYPDVPGQWEGVRKIIESRKSQLVGPITLKQGGQGLILRQPIYLHDGSYWGLVSIVINADLLFSALASHAIANNVIISVVDEENDQVIWGEKINSSEVVKVNLPGRQWALSGKFSTKDNSNELVIIRIVGWFIALGMFYGIYTFLSARQEKNMARAELVEASTRFAQAFATSPQGMALIADDGKWLDVNDGLLNILGYSRATIQGLRLLDLFEVDMQPVVLSKMQALKIAANQNNSTSEQFEAKLIGLNQQVSVGLVSLGVFYQRAEIIHWIMQVADITHRSMMEKLLKEEAKYNQSIINNMADGVVIFDVTGNVSLINHSMRTIFSLGDGFPVTLQDIFSDDFGRDLIAEIAAFGDEQDVIISQRNVQCVAVSGETLALEIDVTKVKRQQVTMYIGVFRDISERLKLDKLKNEFVSTVSHELRTPLTSISASLKLLESGALGEFGADAQKIIAIASTNSNRLKALINDLLDMDKLLAGKMTFNIEVCNACELIRQALENNKSYGDQFKVTYELQLKNIDLDVSALNILVDSQRFQQVLANLLSNAAKFSPLSSTVVVKLELLQDMLRINVLDKGVGIDGLQQEKLFKKFSQIDSTSTRQTGGTGLGLVISKELVERMGGEIGVESALGMGSCFYFTVPLAS